MTKAPIALYNRDDVRLSNIAEEHSGNTVSYAVFSEADFRAYELISQKGKYSFKIRHGDRDIAQITLAVPGKFNVSNALGAFATAYTLGIPAQIIEKALADFQGVERRLQTVGRYRGATVYYDYAHHPTEISNTVTALREMTAGEVTVIFKPHTYSRTAAMMDDFAAALSLADNILLAEIEGIREGAIDGVTSEVLVNKIGRRARLIDEETLIAELSRHKSDAIIIMGAANLSKIKDIIIKQGS